jgi:hypothetical protein
MEIKYVVTQGSILCPLLYLLYIHKWSSSKCIRAETVLLPDDPNIKVIKAQHEDILNQKNK